MKTSELLENLIALFSGNIPQADFKPAYGAAPASRKISKPLVCGEVMSETVKPAVTERRLRFTLYLPGDLNEARDIFYEMCRLTSEKFPAFSAISRSAVSRDRETDLLTVPCEFTFLEHGSPLGLIPVTLAGRPYTAGSFTESVSLSQKGLTSVGEDFPFAYLDDRPEYTVELDGIDPAGLEQISNFEARLGSPPVTYKNCRFKTISPALYKAVFTSRFKEENLDG